MKLCICCGRFLSISNFNIRHDRNSGTYSYCSGCLVEQARTTDYPPKEWRGGGRIEFFDEEFD